MKTFFKKIFLLMAVIVAITVGTVMVVSAYSETEYYTEGDYTYTVADGEAIITGYSGEQEDVVIPDALGGYPVAKINKWSFEDKSCIKRLTIPESVTYIDFLAFEDCSYLNYVKFESTDTKVNDDAFEGCKNINIIELPDASVWSEFGFISSYYDDVYNAYSGGADLYVNGKRITEYVVPAGATTAFFSYCESLEKIILAESVTAISFNGCSSLKSITVPGNVKEIGHRAFQNCRALETVVLCEGVTSIGYCAFENCRNIETITIPKSVETVNDGAFFQCDVDNIFLTDLEAWCNVKTKNNKNLIYGVNYYINGKLLTELTVTAKIKESFFEGCESLQKITFANDVKKIGNRSFRYCKNLQTINIPASVESIGRLAFVGCDMLENITVDKNNKYYCSDEYGVLFNKDKTELVKYPAGIKNKEYRIPDGVKSIGSGAFHNCNNLKSIIIPSSIEVRYSNAFESTEKNILDIYYAGTERQWKEISTAFNDGDDLDYYDSLDYAIYHYNYKPHTHSHTLKTTKATCTKTGTKTFTCSCGDSYIEIIAKTSHTYNTSTTKASLSKNGKIETKCTVCGDISKTTAIYYPKTIKLSATTYTYNNKTKTPSVTVKDSKGNTLKKDVDYTVTYPKKRKSIGKYTVTVTFKGNYSGTKKLTFEIVPAKVTLSKLTAGSKNLTATWKNVSGVTGYEVVYSTSKKFTKKTTKTVTIKKAKSKKTTIKKLKKGKKYYVKVRAYKTVSGKKIYGAYSSVKNVKVK